MREGYLPLLVDTDHNIIVSGCLLPKTQSKCQPEVAIILQEELRQIWRNFFLDYILTFLLIYGIILDITLRKDTKK